MKTNGIPDFLEVLQDNDHTTASAILAIRDELRRQWDAENEARYLLPLSQTPAAVAMFAKIEGTPEWHEAKALAELKEYERTCHSSAYTTSNNQALKAAQVHATLALSKRTGMTK
jgi:hypothetical protein